MKNETKKDKRFRWIPGIIRHDFWRKSAALILAILVTTVVYSNKRRSMETNHNFNNVRPEFYLEEGYEWVKLNPQTVTLNLRGPSKVIADLKVEDFEIRKSVAEKEYVDKHIKLEPKDVICRHPKAGLIRVTGVSPAEYTLHLQKIVTRSLEIKTGNPVEQDSKRIMLDHVGELPPGYFFDGAEILDDTSVNVTGPEHFVKTLRNVLIEPIKLDNHVSTFITTAKLVTPDTSCTLDRSSVRVKIHIGRYLIKKYPYVPIQVLNKEEKPEDGYVALPEENSMVTVELMGEKNEFDTLPDENAGSHIYAFIRRSDLREGNNNMVNIQCVVANKQLRVLSVEPSVINGVVLNLPPKKEEVKEEKEPEDNAAAPVEKEAPAKNEPPAETKGKQANDPQKK